MSAEPAVDLEDAELMRRVTEALQSSASARHDLLEARRRLVEAQHLTESAEAKNEQLRQVMRLIRDSHVKLRLRARGLEEQLAGKGAA